VSKKRQGPRPKRKNHPSFHYPLPPSFFPSIPPTEAKKKEVTAPLRGADVRDRLEPKHTPPAAESEEKEEKKKDKTLLGFSGIGLDAHRHRYSEEEEDDDDDDDDEEEEPPTQDALSHTAPKDKGNGDCSSSKNRCMLNSG